MRKGKQLFAAIAGLSLSVAAAVGVALHLDKNSPYSVAKADPEYVDKDYITLDVGDMNGFKGYYASIDNSSSRESVTVYENGCYSFKEERLNVELAFEFTAISPSGSKSFSVISRGEDTVNITNSRSTGYQLLMYSHGACDVMRGGVKIGGLGSCHNMQVGRKLWFKVVDTTDGLHTHIQVDMEVPGFEPRLTKLSIYDDNQNYDPAVHAFYGMYSEEAPGSGSFTVSAMADKTFASTDIFNVSEPSVINSSAVALDGDGITRIVNPSKQHANSGISFPIEHAGSLEYSAKVSVVERGGADYSAFGFTIGATKTEPSFPSPWKEGAGGWTTAGYIFMWRALGSGPADILLSRGIADEGSWCGGKLLASTTRDNFVVDQSYIVKIRMVNHSNGGVRLSMYIDGVLALTYVDKPSEDGTYSPVLLPESATRTYASIYTRVQTHGKIGPSGATDNVLTWANTYMYMNDAEFDGDGTGRCISENLYLTAKQNLMHLQDFEISAFRNDVASHYTDILARYNAWAAANEDTQPYSGNEIVKSGVSIVNYITSETDNNSMLIVVIAASTVASLILVCAFLHIRRKNK